jgi:hypothetical protein
MTDKALKLRQAVERYTNADAEQRVAREAVDRAAARLDRADAVAREARDQLGQVAADGRTVRYLRNGDTLIVVRATPTGWTVECQPLENV